MGQYDVIDLRPPLLDLNLGRTDVGSQTRAAVQVREIGCVVEYVGDPRVESCSKDEHVRKMLTKVLAPEARRVVGEVRAHLGALVPGVVGPVHDLNAFYPTKFPRGKAERLTKARDAPGQGELLERHWDDAETRLSNVVLNRARRAAEDRIANAVATYTGLKDRKKWIRFGPELLPVNWELGQAPEIVGARVAGGGNWGKLQTASGTIFEFFGGASFSHRDPPGPGPEQQNSRVHLTIRWFDGHLAELPNRRVERTGLVFPWDER